MIVAEPVPVVGTEGTSFAPLSVAVNVMGEACAALAERATRTAANKAFFMDASVAQSIRNAPLMDHIGAGAYTTSIWRRYTHPQNPVRTRFARARPDREG